MWLVVFHVFFCFVVLFLAYLFYLIVCLHGVYFCGYSLRFFVSLFVIRIFPSFTDL